MVSVRPFAALNIDTRMIAAMTLPAAGPSTALTASAATRSLAITPPGPSATRYAAFANK